MPLPYAVRRTSGEGLELAAQRAPPLLLGCTSSTFDPTHHPRHRQERARDPIVSSISTSYVDASVVVARPGLSFFLATTILALTEINTQPTLHDLTTPNPTPHHPSHFTSWAPASPARSSPA